MNTPSFGHPSERGENTRGIEEKGWKWYYLIGGETV